MRTRDAASCCASDTTGLADAVLAEISDLLEAFAARGEEGAVDLRGLPMTDADRQSLEARLGRGEVEATLDVAGRSEVWETGYSGVWWLRHFGTDDRVKAEEILITRIPALLQTHVDDARAAARRLNAELAESAREHSEEEGTHA